MRDSFRRVRFSCGAAVSAARSHTRAVPAAVQARRLHHKKPPEPSRTRYPSLALQAPISVVRSARGHSSAVSSYSVSREWKWVAWAEFGPPGPNFARGRLSARVATGRLRSYFAPPAHAAKAKPRQSVTENGTSGSVLKASPEAARLLSNQP